jgi:hypothetical protein
VALLQTNPHFPKEMRGLEVTMETVFPHRHVFIRQLWSASRSLSLIGWLLLADAVICLGMMTIDPQQITGIDAWIKPAKFGLSSSVTCLTLAWIASYLTEWPRLRKWSARVFASSIALEIVIINTQAARGTTSHFNVSTPIDKTAFIVMGFSIATLWCAMAAMTYALFRQKISAPSWRWGLQLGLLVSLIGAAAGGFMLHQTAEQKAADDKYRGAHTVGAPDGGPGIPFLDWSTQHGDLRVGHFLGLHGVQVIPLIAWWLSRRNRLSETQRVQLIQLSSAAYFVLFGLVTWQALRGVPPLRPDTLTRFVFGVAFAATVLAGAAIVVPELRHTARTWVQRLDVRS